MNTTQSAIASLKAEVDKAPKDVFDPGTVVRWSVEGNTKDYLYAAIKTSDGWYTTSVRDTGLVAKVLDYDGLIEALSKRNAFGIAVATAWSDI